MNKNKIPDPVEHLEIVKSKLQNKEPLTFIRFSDGETEILNNRYLEIIPGGKIVCKGKESKNKFPEFDSKKFDPAIHQNIRKDLLNAAKFKAYNFFKGIQTGDENDSQKAKKMMIDFNNGFDEFLTFTDLFLNSNYKKYLKEVVPLFQEFDNITVVANYRAIPTGILSEAVHIKVQDNFFANYDEVLDKTLSQLKDIETGSLVLCSASSLSNILGHKLFLERKDITFLDIGTSLNHLLTLDHKIRGYLKEGHASIFRKVLRKIFKKSNQQIKW